MTADEFLRHAAAAIEDQYQGDCLKRARTLCEMLRAEGRDAWIGRLRKVEQRGEATFHGPLTPLKYRGRSGPTWTTHYVCCCDGMAFDPIAGEPVSIEEFSRTIFGEEIPIERV